ncbi:hypothetical protein J6590_084957 [Homalodisca vitripennis]|nr:hypothetical protein J6590_084957 [Homalodisca vitripennis]
MKIVFLSPGQVTCTLWPLQVVHVTYADISTTDVTLSRHAVSPHPDTFCPGLSNQFYANFRPHHHSQIKCSALFQEL